MSFKRALHFVLAIFVFSFSLLLFSQSQVSAEITCPSPSPVGVTEGDWVYEIGGASRHRTLTTNYVDPNQGDCGFTEEIQTEYSYCDDNQTVWDSELPTDVVLGQCQNDPYSTTICVNGETLEVSTPVNTNQYPEYTEGQCLRSPDPSTTPEPTPTCSENQHLDASGMRCVDWSQSGGGDNGGGSSSNNGGQVLGASTGGVLAATGNTENIIGLSLIVLGLGVTSTSLYAYSKNKYN